MTICESTQESALECLRLIGRSPEEQIEDLLKQSFAHYYEIWKVLNDVYGPEIANTAPGNNWQKRGLYCCAWDWFVFEGMPAIFASLGVTDLSHVDIPTLGKAIEIAFNGVPGLYETIENTPERHVGNVRFCANPKYGPPDTYLTKCAYYTNEKNQTEAHFKLIVNQIMGKSDEIRPRVEQSICTGADFCTFVFEPKDALPSDTAAGTLPTQKDATIFEVLAEQGVAVADQFVSTTRSYVRADLGFYQGVEELYGIEEATKIHGRVWTGRVGLAVRTALEALDLSEVDDMATLGRVVRRVHDDWLTPFKPTVDTPARFQGLVLESPFVSYARDLYGQGPDSTYQKALASSSLKRAQAIVEACQVPGVTVTQDRSLALGDEVGEICFARS